MSRAERRGLDELSAGLAADVVDWFLPNCNVFLLLDLVPAEALRDGFDCILLRAQILLSPLPPLPVALPVDGRPRQDPVPSGPQDAVDFDQVLPICQCKSPINLAQQVGQDAY